MKSFHVLNGENLHFSDHNILNRQGWPDFLTTWVKIRNFLSIMLLRLPCYSAYWWVVRLFWSSLGGGVGCLCDVTKPSLLGKLTNQQQAAGKWFHCKVLNILLSFPWSITVETMKSCCRFFFTITLTVFNLTSISFEIFWKVKCTRQRETNFATITSFPWSVHLSNKALHQSAHKKSLSFCKMNISRNYDHYLGVKLEVVSKGVSSVQVVTSGLATLLLQYILLWNFWIMLVS